MKTLGSKLDFPSIAYGMNADDTKDYRPGQRAAKEHDVLAPLAEAGLTSSKCVRWPKQRATRFGTDRLRRASRRALNTGAP